MGLALLCDKFTQTIKNTKLYFVFIDLAGRQAASYCFVRQAHITASQTPRPLLTISTITRISTEWIYIIIIIIIISLALLLSQTTKNTELISAYNYKNYHRRSLHLLCKSAQTLPTIRLWKVICSDSHVTHKCFNNLIYFCSCWLNTTFKNGEEVGEKEKSGRPHIALE